MALEMTRRNAIAAAAVAGVAAAGVAGTAHAEVEKQASAGVITADASIDSATVFGFTSEKPAFMTAPEPVADDQIVDTAETEIPSAEFRWMQTCGNRCNEVLIAQYMARSGEAADWLCEAGEKHHCSMGIWDGYSRNPLLPDEPGYVCMGGTDESDLTIPGGSFVAADVCHLEAIENGAEFRFNTKAEYLLQDESGAVTGAVVSDADGYKKIVASKGVVIATGDIAGDEEMCTYYCPEALPVQSVNTPVGANNGDGHKMILWAGGTMQSAPFPPMLHPQRWADPGSNQLEGPFLYVNEKGERFFNEGTWVQARSLQIMKHTADDCAWSIFDSSWPEDLMASFPYGGGMFWDMFRYKGESDYQTTIDYYTQSLIDNEGYTYEKADTLEELAEKIGVPAEQLTATVERYNALCAEGVDEDFCKNPALLYPIDEPPFYASKVGAVLLEVVGGAKINTNLQCLDGEGNPIPGLYAIGNAGGDSYAVDYPINVPGNSHGRALTQGYLVGRKLAGVE